MSTAGAIMRKGKTTSGDVKNVLRSGRPYKLNDVNARYISSKLKKNYY